MKIYLSSTYQDLAEHRAAVDQTLRQMGHDVIGMEQYVAEGAKPLARCLDDVALADLYVVIVGWRYGYAPKDQPPPGGLSITELEYRHAMKVGRPVLAFLLDPESPWPPSRVDALGADPQAAIGIAAFRALLGTSHLAGIFRTPDNLASLVAAAVSRQGLNRFMVDRVLMRTSALAEEMQAFSEGTQLDDTTLENIKQMVAASGSARALIVDLEIGWWSTRLFLLSNLLLALTGVRQLVFRRPDGGFYGMVSPLAVVEQLAAEFPLCAAFLEKLRATEPSSDTEREMTRQTDAWKEIHEAPFGPGEHLAKVDVRPVLLERWLGERLITRCLQVEPQGLTLTTVQQIIDSLVPYVPIEEWHGTAAAPTRELQVIDRDAFASELAREWVRTSLPRNPVG